MKSFILPILAATSVLSTLSLIIPSSASAGAIRDRQINQQVRIYNGVQQGTISQQEYKKLELREAKIAAQRRVYLKDGDLSGKEAVRLTAAQNRTSRAIYRDRHD
ncbi:hypothetical protein [Pseudanabaena mucicola]|uniref:SHOCT domain-containing protein n=1 Tax=Pseudanabaena mucicola FACHB-723 TaxID=2692860 RepID=A0ABR7ZZ68_9CYAN|nr:hypothetical protein [Pseudanabaena mucicola]MBD2188713.1 hypothetical protein [Pseudanabaena mucicola FACHB-723]